MGLRLLPGEPCFVTGLEDMLGFRGDFRYRVLLSVLVLQTALIPKACCAGDEKSSGDEQQPRSRE